MGDRKHREGLNRRDFLCGTAGATLGLSALGSVSAAQGADPPEKRTPTDLVPLGKTGVQLSRLGLGTGVKGGDRQSNQTRLGFERFVALLRHCYDSGVRFFDMADLYGSHVYVREALRSIPREKVTLQTKVWWRYGESPHSIIERFCHELDTDYLDVVLLHCLSEPDWDKKLTPYMDMLAEMKEKKKVRAVGISCHNLEALKTAAQSPWVDTVLARINHVGTEAMMDGSPDQVVPVLQQLSTAGKGVVGMKIFGEGRLLDQREQSLRYVCNLGCVDSMVIGFETPEQVNDTLKMMASVL